MLETRGLSVFYGRHKALEDVAVRVDTGEICVVLGANGAGKSTLLMAIAGMVNRAPGTTVLVDGTPVAGRNPAAIVEAGVALVPEGRGIFGDLTVRENLTLGAYARRARTDEQANLKRIYALFPRLAERRGQIARTMSGGEQQMVAIGRALMSRPDILMLDEPSLGLSPLLCTQLFARLKDIGETGVGILLVEQNAKQSLAIADRGYLLENGQIIGEDTAHALATDPAVRHAYLGGPAEAAPAGPQPSQDARALSGMAEDLARTATESLSAHIASLRAAVSAAAAPVESAPYREPPPDARRLAAVAAALAQRAADIQAACIRARRTGNIATAPQIESAPAASPSTAGDLSAMAADMAKRAADIHSAHIRSRRIGTDK